METASSIARAAAAVRVFLPGEVAGGEDGCGDRDGLLSRGIVHGFAPARKGRVAEEGELDYSAGHAAALLQRVAQRLNSRRVSEYKVISQGMRTLFTQEGVGRFYGSAGLHQYGPTLREVDPKGSSDVFGSARDVSRNGQVVKMGGGPGEGYRPMVQRIGKASI